MTTGGWFQNAMKKAQLNTKMKKKILLIQEPVLTVTHLKFVLMLNSPSKHDFLCNVQDTNTLKRRKKLHRLEKPEAVT